jgi:hypothetical protein
MKFTLALRRAPSTRALTDSIRNGYRVMFSLPNLIRHDDLLPAKVRGYCKPSAARLGGSLVPLWKSRTSQRARSPITARFSRQTAAAPVPRAVGPFQSAEPTYAVWSQEVSPDHVPDRLRSGSQPPHDIDSFSEAIPNEHTGSNQT